MLDDLRPRHDLGPYDVRHRLAQPVRLVEPRLANLPLLSSLVVGPNRRLGPTLPQLLLPLLILPTRLAPRRPVPVQLGLQALRVHFVRLVLDFRLLREREGGGGSGRGGRAGTLGEDFRKIGLEVFGRDLRCTSQCAREWSGGDARRVQRLER